jgi:AcrR family transcriptional regulator
MALVGTTDAHTPWGRLVLEDAAEGTPTRILDAAMVRFSEQGITSTTMSQLAADVGISRVWLYRYFSNRDAVVAALLGREAKRFLDALVALIDPSVPVTEGVCAAFEFSVVTLRGHELLQKVLTLEPEVAAPFITSGIGPMLHAAGVVIASHLEQGASMEPSEATVVSDAILRLVMSIVVNNETQVDFDDPAQRRAFIDRIVPRLVGPDA